MDKLENLAIYLEAKYDIDDLKTKIDYSFGTTNHKMKIIKNALLTLWNDCGIGIVSKLFPLRSIGVVMGWDEFVILKSISFVFREEDPSFDPQKMVSSFNRTINGYLS